MKNTKQTKERSGRSRGGASSYSRQRRKPTLLNKYGPYQENTQAHGSNPESSSHNVEVPEVCPQIGPAGAECPQRPTGISEVCPPEGPADFKIINLNSCTKSKMKKVSGFGRKLQNQVISNQPNIIVSKVQNLSDFKLLWKDSAMNKLKKANYRIHMLLYLV